MTGLKREESEKKKNVLVSFSREKQVANLAGGVCLSPFFFSFFFFKVCVSEIGISLEALG